MIAQVVPILLAFGSNLGDRSGTIAAAQRELAGSHGIIEFAASPLRETIALTLDGPDESAPRYVNGVARATTTLSPHELLDLLQRMESTHGRTREARWGDRTLDVDLILFGGRVVQDERLTVPHPRAFERDFVLAPWLALEPDAVLMGHGRVAELLARVGDTTLPLSATTEAADAAVRETR
ncbi:MULTISPECIES: 2-amino-4-hydroxy-6-hydroxymethyldihydropteridine diphosphokinase [unclassified Leucobacter]|uniref:2-amino-4-hydroxy-6- hydroxymethyldihydropteridine diphosphokinase n=1 Tax=unclassified Leucobacter TaxID=2621730 RepID=UPI00165E74EB|nr:MULTISPECIES: 2-amino-4-hydroxy-6-hydroxymethyldihydropteridine diphosphokinase [unclassified Leucobacter]MBC9937388.1 2-amino-4-hydroxy-6-hydroxymethyldihydropteridine diphosphokinase [Leucobacter sp. cx-87]